MRDARALGLVESIRGVEEFILPVNDRAFRTPMDASLGHPLLDR